MYPFLSFETSLSSWKFKHLFFAKQCCDVMESLTIQYGHCGCLETDGIPPLSIHDMIQMS